MTVWNLDNLFRLEDTDTLIAQLQEKAGEFAKLRGRLERLKPDEFMDVVAQQEKIVELASRLSGRAELALSENTSDPERTAYASRISQVVADAQNKMVFFELWFKKLDDEAAQRFLEVSGKYRYMLEQLRLWKDFALEEREEQIVNLKDLTGSRALTKVYDMITSKFRFEFKDKKMSQEEINQFKQSPVREERVAAYELVLGRYGKEQDVLAELYTSLARDWRNEYVSVRGFKSPIAVRNRANDVPDKAVQALLSVVQKNIGLFREYFELKKTLCEMEDRYDLYAPYSSKVREYPFEESKKLVLDVYKEFDEKAYALAKQIFDDGHVHADVTENKRSGAFCYTVLKDVTPYILLNHVGKLSDVFTMAHEFGHGIHGLAAQHQTQFTYHSALPLAETASVFGEMLLAKRLLRDAGKEEKKAVLVKLLDGQYATIIRQSYFILFEIAAHELIAKGCTVHELNKLYHENVQEQFGKVLPVGTVFQHEWKYIPHIYHTPFYCYAYAFGNLLVLALYKMYEEQGKDFVPKYMKILSYGGSASPQHILSEVGIDITKESFWQQGFDVIKEELEQLRKLA